jgi:proteic killer suppression protein
VIRTFAHKGLERLFREGSLRGIQPRHGQRLVDILARIHSATDLEDLRAPDLRLHRLKGALHEHWSIRVSGNWRVTFRFNNGDAFDVNYQDYH